MKLISCEKLETPAAGRYKKIPPVKGRDEGKRLIAKAEC